MENINNNKLSSSNGAGNVRTQIDSEGYQWIYKGEINGYESWDGIPPENL